METTDYTHLSDASVDDILRRFGIVSNPPQPQHQPEPQTEPEMPMPFGDPEEPASGNEESAAEEVVHIDSDSIINNIVGSSPSLPEELQQQSVQENLPKVIVRREYFDNVFMSRFVGAPWASSVADKEVLVAGMGGIGSWASLLIARLGVKKLTLIDFDTIEKHNLSGQFYGKSQVGLHKTAGIKDSIDNYADNVGVETRSIIIDENFPVSSIPEITICGFDNMEARKIMFKKWKERVASVPERQKKFYLFVDGRLSINTLQVFSFTGEDKFYIKEYEKKYLFSDDDADATMCSAKQTSFMANMIGSFISNVLVSFCYGALPTGLPFFIEYDSDTFGLRVLR